MSPLIPGPPPPIFSDRPPIVVLADDDVNYHKSFALSLKTLGVDTVAFADPHALLAWLRSSDEEVATIVADLRMPEMSGLDFLLKAGEARPGTARVLTTGASANQAEQERSETAGLPLIPKPLVIEAIKAHLPALIEPTVRLREDLRADLLRRNSNLQLENDKLRRALLPLSQAIREELQRLERRLHDEAVSIAVEGTGQNPIAALQDELGNLSAEGADYVRIWNELMSRDRDRTRSLFARIRMHVRMRLGF